ncbi:diphosphoinositol polyphosphate phosphohydrolase 3-beta-like isoform X3 [Myxocyprinus asiaticus]|uniref:diphosphoinositol polyphosphate phosphohydrolase 3-beta-like isoform X3 n=1 Tax=Myxocyprinus asiaticus TaxID=70543 RepID=UPI002222F9C9|nr:diphosphoinositol polyphosphate phosphohydrolase 3-beta-like isoform X3 [Myxocyprinus asiaticus]
MIKLDYLGRLSAPGLKGSCVARDSQTLINREHLYSCFVRRKPHMMKFKPNQTRTYDGEGFKKRAACLCFKNDREDEAGVRGTLGRLLGVFEQNQDSKHRTYVYVLTVTETLEDWEDSVSIGRKRKWFKIDEAIQVLQCHKPVHAEYLHKLSPRCSPTNGNSQEPVSTDDNAPLHQTASQDCGLARLQR